jgi:outer membrane protein assembly factor BamB
VILTPATGQVRAEHAWKPSINASVNAASPVVWDEHVFLSTSYGRGAIVLKFDGQDLHSVWNTDEALSNHYATSVYWEGHLYGFHGRQERGCSLRCVEAQSGRVLWSHEGLGAGSVMVAQGNLLVLTERGQLLRVATNPETYTLAGQTQILGTDTRAFPALAHGRFYARDKSRLVCLDLR